MTLNVPYNIKQAIKNASARTGVPEDLLTAFAYIESGFAQDVIEGKRRSHTQVRGLFQITGSTWKLARKLSDNQNERTLGYSLDVNEQAYTAALLIKDLLQKYNNDYTLTAIAYNAGEGVASYVKRYGNNTSTIRRAVALQRAKNQKGFGEGKEKEVTEYPIRLLKALGKPVVISENTNYNYDVTNSTKTSTSNNFQTNGIEYNAESSFIENVFSNGHESISKMHEVVQKSPDTIKNSILVKRINEGKAALRSKK